MERRTNLLDHPSSTTMTRRKDTAFLGSLDNEARRCKWATPKFHSESESRIDYRRKRCMQWLLWSPFSSFFSFDVCLTSVDSMLKITRSPLRAAPLNMKTHAELDTRRGRVTSGQASDCLNLTESRPLVGVGPVAFYFVRLCKTDRRLTQWRDSNAARKTGDWLAVRICISHVEMQIQCRIPEHNAWRLAIHE